MKNEKRHEFKCSDITIGAERLNFTEPASIDFETNGPPKYKLALVREVTRKSDGSVEMSFGPAPRCERCRHWDSRGEFGYCCIIRDNRYEPGVSAWTGDGEGLGTVPEFGCSLYEPKETP